MVSSEKTETETESSLRAAIDEFDTHLKWLQAIAGETACRKFMGAKLYAPPFSGTYISGILPTVEGYRFLIELLDQLKRGMEVPLVDVQSYYAHGRRVPQGMRLEGNQLIDTWPEADPSWLQRPTRNPVAEVASASGRRLPPPSDRHAAIMITIPLSALQSIAKADQGTAEALAASMREVGDITSLSGHWCRACSALLEAFAYEARREGASGHEAAPCRGIESKHQNDFDFDFSSIEIPKGQLSKKEATELANKILSATSNPDEYDKPPGPKPRKARKSRKSRK